MEQLKNTVTIFDNTVRNWLSVIDNNEYVTAALTLFLIVYASYAVPKLPANILKLFDNPLFKLLIFFFIVYTAKKNPTVAIIAAVALLVSIHALNKLKLDQMMMMMLSKETGQMTEHQLTDNMPRPANELVMEHMMQQETEMHPSAIMELKEENKSEPKNSFYPQYANIKPNAHMGMFDGNSVGGFDPDSAYASI